jgi:O-antigen/teichoic acid export membrane protein
MLNEAVWEVLHSGDRFLVQHYLGAMAVGYYSAAYNMATYVQELMIGPVNLALVPMYVSLWANKGKESTREFVSRTLNHFLVASVFVVSIVAVTSSDLVGLLASEKYREAHRLLPVLLTGLLIAGLFPFLKSGLFLHNETRKLLRPIAYSAVTNVALNIVLLPRMGLMGGALAALVGYALLAVLMAHTSFKRLPLRIDYVSLTKHLLAGSIVFALFAPVDIGWRFGALLIKGTLAPLLYLALVLAFDANSRTVVQMLLVSFCRRFLPQSQFATGAAKVAGD